MTFRLLVILLVAIAIIPSEIFTQEYQPIHRSPKHIASPRVAYSTSIFHQDTKNPDQTAHSSIKVNIDSDKSAYRHSNAAAVRPQTQSQMFNVGYSMSFNGDAAKLNKQYQNSFVRKPTGLHNNNNNNNGEIITGKRKKNEEVRVPMLDMSMSPQEFVSQALMNNKVYMATNKIVQTKPRQNFNTQTTAESLINQAHFSPKIQQYIKAYEKTKSLRHPSVQKPKIKPQTDYNWRSLGNGVEIVKSSEIPINHKLSNEPVTYTTESLKPAAKKTVKKMEFDDPVEPITHKYIEDIKEEFDPVKDFNYNFNHANALENSQSFDFSNGLESNNLKQHELQPFYANPAFKNIPISKLKIDTSLLREPIITTDPNEVVNNPRAIPIHFDIRPIQQAMQNPDAFAKKPQEEKYDDKAQDGAAYQVGPYQNYQQQPMYEDYGYQDYQTAAQSQFKIYGKPQPVKKLFKPNGNYSDKPRQPRHDVEDALTDLRPPPISHKAYQRRAYNHHHHHH